MVKKTVILCLLLCGVITNACFADLTDQLLQAMKYQEQDNYTEAETIYRDIMTNHPDTGYATMAKIGLARMYKRAKRYSEAEPIYLEVLAGNIDPDYEIEACKHLTILYIASGRDSDAQAVVDQIRMDFRNHPELPYVLNGIARSYKRYGNEQAAVAMNQSIKADFPGSYHAFLANKRLIALGIGSETNPAAQSAIDQLAGKLPHHRVQSANTELPDINEILSDVNGLVTSYKDYPYLPGIISRIAEEYYTKGLFLSAKEQTDEALSYYRKAARIYDVFIEEFSDSASQFSHLAGFAYDSAGYCYYELGDYQKSANSYQKLANDCTGHPIAWNGLAMIGRNYEKLEKAGLVSVLQAKTNIKLAYERLVTQYPDCKAARMANSWLRENNPK